MSLRFVFIDGSEVRGSMPVTTSLSVLNGLIGHEGIVAIEILGIL